MNVYYSDNNAFCCSVLRKQIAAGNLYQGFVDERDIREISGDELRGYGQVHLFAGIGGFPLGFKWAGLPASMRILTGGFPCQDISFAGFGAGIYGERSGLWAEMHRIIRSIRPDWVVVENVSALLARGIGAVLRDLAEAGFDAEWAVLRAQDFGAPHERERLFIVAYPNTINGQEGMGVESDGKAQIFATDHRQRLQVWIQAPDLSPRMDDGLPSKLDHVHRGGALGNAIVPQIAQWLGERILEAERQISKLCPAPMPTTDGP